MASGKVLEKLRQLYAKVDADVKRWATLQEQALSLMRTTANVIARLPALEDKGSYGTLAALPGLPCLLLSKQLVALDELIVQLQACLDDMQLSPGNRKESLRASWPDAFPPVQAARVVADDVARQAQQAQRFVQQDRSLTPAVCAVSAGPIPSITQCLAGLEDISRMHAEELRLKYALVHEVQYDTSEADMQQLAALFAAQLHIDGGRVRDLLHVVAATQEKRLF